METHLPEAASATNQQDPAKEALLTTAPASTTRRESTTELPMVELKDIVEFVNKIHEEGLEVAPMPDVALKLGYKNPSSTPFYRRMAGARLFGLLVKPSGAQLTQRARDVLKPSREGAKEDALREALLEIPLYRERLNELDGKRLNSVYLANAFSRGLPITEACAAICAKVFESSVKYSGLVSSDGTISCRARPSEKTESIVPPNPTETEFTLEPLDIQSHTLFLDKQKQRRFQISAPLEVSQVEFARIRRWLEAVLNVDTEPDQT
jgi:hypothetical protein